MPTDSRSRVIDAIRQPLGFFALALLIGETFLAMVLIYSNLENSQKYIGMWAGLVLLILVIFIVAILVWCKPRNLVFGEESHLRDLYGTNTLGLSSEDLEKSKRVEYKEVRR